MKKLGANKVQSLFKWLKTYYSTDATPKIAILLLNRKEWRRFYEESPSITREEFEKKLDEKIAIRSKAVQTLIQHINQLSESRKSQLHKILHPHFCEQQQDINYWMNESFGKCFPVKRLKRMSEMLGQDVPEFFNPYMNHDFVIIISNFFNEEQEKKFDQPHIRDILIYAIVFHELLHVIEACTGTHIFEDAHDRITFQLARTFFEGHRRTALLDL